jgi:hypothetical protein
MPRKRPLTRISISDIPVPDRYTSSDQELVRSVLVDFDEVAMLPDKICKQLVEYLAVAARIACGGIKAGIRHRSDKAIAKHIFMRDVRCALEWAGLPVKQWFHDEDGRESLYFQIAHAVGDVFGLKLPRDLEPLAVWAAKIKHGEMSPAMKAEQHAEIMAIWRRQAGLWVYTLVNPPRSCEELASAYLGFPF